MLLKGRIFFMYSNDLLFVTLAKLVDAPWFIAWDGVCVCVCVCANMSMCCAMVNESYS